MKKVLFNVELIDRHYIFYLDDETNKLHAFAVKKNNKTYFVTKNNEIDFLGKIIDFLNKKYIRRNDVLYKNDYYARYVNRYNRKSYFAKLVDGNQVAMPYESIKELYDYYNAPKIEYIGRNRKQNNSNSYGNIYNDSYNGFDDFEFEPPTYSPSPYEQPNYQKTNSRRPSQRGKSGNNRLKIFLGVAGAIATISLSAAGYYFLSHGGKLPVVSKPQIEETYGEVDTKADTDKEKEIQEKYDQIRTQLEEAGLANWEISSELQLIALFDGETDDISFYYDSDEDKVVYVYEDLDRENEKLAKDESEEDRVSTETEGVEIPENVETILEAIAENDNLTEEEKTFVGGTVLDELIENSEYINVDELVYRYGILDIDYEYHENGKTMDDLFGSPYTEAAGLYINPVWHENIESLREDGMNVDAWFGDMGGIHVYNADTLEGSIEDDEAVLPHELRTCKWKF